MPRVPGFSEEVLIGPLRAGSASHSDNPWLVAFWPGVREEQMAAACAESIRRGHAIRSVVLPGRRRGAARSGWAVAVEGGSERSDAS
jgi:hypothetical protein